MIEIKPDDNLDRYRVCDGGQTAFWLEVEDTGWKIYGPIQPDKPPIFRYDLDKLFYPAGESVEQRERELQRLEDLWDNNKNFLRLLDFVGQIIQYFYADHAAGMRNEDSWELAARGAKLCRLFLDFLDPKHNLIRAERYHATRLVLQRAYYFNLAHLYEEEGEIRQHPESRSLKRYLDGWELPREHRASLRIWHRVILREENNWLFRDLLGTDREDEMWSVLVRKDGDPQLRGFFAEAAGRTFVEHVIDRWFLARYDLGAAQLLQHAVDQSKAGDGASTRIEQPPWWLRFWSWGGVGLGVVFFALSLPCELVMWEWAQARISSIVVGLSLLLLLGVGIGFVKGARWLRFQLPNLLAAVPVGYFPLLLADEPWIFGIRLSDAGLVKAPHLLLGTFTFLGFAFVVAGLSFVYLLSRIRAIGVAESTARKRASDVFIRGISYSFMVGVVAVDVMGGRLFDLMSRQQEIGLWGPFVLVEELPGLTGWVYPSVVWVFMWLALFVGLFVQCGRPARSLPGRSKTVRWRHAATRWPPAIWPLLLRNHQRSTKKLEPGKHRGPKP